MPGLDTRLSMVPLVAEKLLEQERFADGPVEFE